MVQSILGGLFGPPVKPYDPAEAWAQKDSGQRFDEATYGAGQGFGQAAGALLGADLRPDEDKRRQAIERIKAQIAASGAEPGSDEFYKMLAMALQREGFPAEALAVGQQWQTERRARSKDDLAIREMKRKELKDIAGSAEATERNAVARARLTTTGPEVLQLLAQLDATTEPTARAAITKRINFLSTKEGVKFEDLGDRVNVTDLAGNVIRTDTKGAAPLSAKDTAKAKTASDALGMAYATAMQKWQSNYDAAAKLYNHAGLDALAGRFSGIAGDPTATGNQAAVAALSGPGREALALFQQVQGGTFLAGLAELKAESKTGSTGLGAVSEIEGGKVQSAKAALSPRQEPAAFRRQLETYIKSIEQSVSILNSAANGEQVAPFALQTVALTGPARAARPAKPSAPATNPAVPAAPAVGGWSAKRK